MRLSDLAGKEVINIEDGARLGVIEDCDLTFDSQSGAIETIILPNRGGLFHFFGDSRSPVIPWQSIKRIGDEVIIVDLSNSFERIFRQRGQNPR